VSISFFIIISSSACVNTENNKEEYNEHIQQYLKCVENKQKEKSYKYANIQEALNAYDFEVAREYLACHPDRDYYAHGEKLNVDINSDPTLSSLKDFTQNPYMEDLKLIINSEVAYFISEGEMKKAEAAAKEAGMMNIYKKIVSENFENKLDEMIEKKEFIKIYTFLSGKRGDVQKTPYNLSEPFDREFGSAPNNTYNNIIREFNALLDKILVKYKYLKVEKEEIKAVLELALPELVNKNEKNEYDGSKFYDVYKKEATAKYLK
jgi:hypothetical protein